MTEREKQHSGHLYQPGDPTILEEQTVYADLLMEYNTIPHSRMDLRSAMLRRLFAEVGEGCYIETPVHANWGGHHVHLGKNVYANFGLSLVDDTHIYIGDYTMLGPNVTIATAGHPIDPELRRQGLQFNMPVRIGNNCWLGAGVTVGDNTVIGAGSVVTKDIPSGVVAAGNPCRVLREVGERDREFYFKDCRVDPVWRKG